MLTPQFTPLYSQIRGLLLQSMQSGEWKPGELMPSEMELAQRYQVSHGTVRKAIDALAAENHVTRRQGKGTFVATHTEQSSQYRFLRLVPDVGDAAAEGPATRQILSFVRERASADVARALGIKSQESVWSVQRLLSLGGTPTILEHIWLAAHRFKGLTADQLLHHAGSTYSLYETGFDTRVLRASERIRAVAASDDTAEKLQVAAGTPLLQVERIAYTYNDQPMELRHAYCRTDTHHYKNELL
jgi:GntR family transcriptional regulator